MPKRKTHEQFVNELKEINPNVEVLGQYKNTHTKILVKCNIHDYEWEITPHHLLQGHGCPKCAKCYRRTHEEFIEELKEVNPNIEILNKFKNNKTRMKCKCKICGHEWETVAEALINARTGCPKCARRYNRTHEEFMEEVYSKNHNIEILSHYNKNHDRIKCKCKICSHEWEVIAEGILYGRGCPKCARKIVGDKTRKTHEEFIEELKNINPYVEIISKYQCATEKIKCRCKIDGYEWEATPYNLLNNHGCPKCTSSKGEREIFKVLDNKNIDYLREYRFEDCKYKTSLPFDFYLPQYNCCIEFDGQQHYEIVDYWGGLDGFINTKIRDTIKTIYCKENNIKLIRIPYWDFDRIEEILDIF